MGKLQANVLIVLMAAVLGLLAWSLFADGEGAPEAEPAASEAGATADRREPVLFNAEQHQFALAQMRGLLVTIRDLDAAEMAGDTARMARIARAEGPGQAQNREHPAGFHEALPDGFRAMSRTMRQAFGGMADDLEEENLQAYRAKRQQALGNCVACHESYRFEVQP